MTAATAQAGRGALLSESASRDALALVRWTAPELAAVARAVADTLGRTVQRWSAGDRVRQHVAALETGLAPAIHADEGGAALRAAQWTTLGAHAHLAVDVDPVQCLREGLFGELPVSPGARDGQRIADQLASECWSEQCAALQSLLEEARAGALQATTLDLARMWRRWSGAVVVAAPWFGTTLHLLLDTGAVHGLLRSANLRRPQHAAAKRTMPVPVLHALAKAPVRLEVRLAPLDIDLGSLVSLGLGDVLRLGHAVDEPLHVVAPGSPTDADPLCHGWLGERGPRVALELARPRAGAKALSTPSSSLKDGTDKAPQRS